MPPKGVLFDDSEGFYDSKGDVFDEIDVYGESFDDIGG